MLGLIGFANKQGGKGWKSMRNSEKRREKKRILIVRLIKRLLNVSFLIEAAIKNFNFTPINPSSTGLI